MKKLKDNVYWVGARDWEVRQFHGNEYSTHRGTSYNAYLVMGEKNVLIDSVAEDATPILLKRIQDHVELCDIDYIIINHAEPDHAGSLAILMDKCENAQLISSVKGVESITETFHKDWDIQTVKTGDELDLGNGEKLHFIDATMLHWPDSMFTYMSGANILFSNDAFGQHLASWHMFNDEVDKCELDQEALKYYANILTPFSPLVTRKINEIVEMNVPLDIIAPSHGIIWRENPIQIVEKYLEWAKNEPKDRVIIAYNTMYGSTKKLAEYIGFGLEDAGVDYRIYNASSTDMNDLLTQIYQSKGVIFGASTINNGPLVSLYPVIKEMQGLKYLKKVGATFGSYGWSGESPKVLQGLLEDAKVEIIQDSIAIKYVPNSDELQKCLEFGKSFGEKMLAK